MITSNVVLVRIMQIEFVHYDCMLQTLNDKIRLNDFKNSQYNGYPSFLEVSQISLFWEL